MVLWLTFINFSRLYYEKYNNAIYHNFNFISHNPILILIIVTLHLSECAYISQVQLYLLLEFFNLIIMIYFLNSDVEKTFHTVKMFCYLMQSNLK